jgi:hypothetical protein
MGKRVEITNGDYTQIIWDCDLDKMKSYGWVLVEETTNETKEEIENGNI